ncbi:toxin glutamine deamidase domain-containing protein [Micromonospora sp. WMMD980]|uniref:toxin glutamine deamidase domain-containing protein n=1 Tax=Micromonospora sp. WMMD980 TaxID=3016088 RepID=UPI002417FA00|nr:toxin glutamine deamidase domain-containing protein [Micromonospora sp. WMMD980]MDG4802789.1 toxin glutamine deamidase domain-containing protein [Micromonospora sp. WMMD980]
MLPSPIPHPLDYCPWELPGWIYETLDWVVGVEWPEGNERAVWDLADQWYGVAGVLTGPRDDAVTAAGEVKSGYGGVGLVAHAFDTAWDKVAGDEDAPLHVLAAATDELGRLVDSCGCDIEGAKLEAWIELGILVVELLSLVVVTALTLGTASPAAGAAIAATRVAVQQIFKRLVAQLARNAVREGLKEAGERAAKEVVKSGARGLARKAVLGGLVEAGQEAGTSLATQAYQNSTGRRDGLDLTDVGASGLGGFAGGAAAPLAGLGRHASGRFARVGEHFGREMAGESLAETAAGLATGQGPSLEDLARAAASGVSGSATGQADTALHHRLDGKLGGSTALPVGLDVPPGTDPAASIPAQRPPEPAVSVHTGGPVAGHARTDLTSGTPSVAAPAIDASASTHPSPADSARPAPGASTSPASPSESAGAPAVTIGPAHGAIITTPTLSSVTVDAPTASASLVGPTDVRGGLAPAPPDMASPPATPVHAAASVTLSPPTTDSTYSVVTTPPDRLVPGGGEGHIGASTAPTVHPHTTPSPGAPAIGPEPRPAPNPRFPLLETLAPPRPSTDSPAPFHGPPDRPAPRRETPQQRAARVAADREALDRRRYQGYLASQRALHEENRRQSQVRELRDLAEQHYEAARWLLTRGYELREAGQHHLADQHVREGRLREQLHYRAVDEADAVRAGKRLPERVMVEDDLDFYRINDDVADLAPGAVETADESALSGHRHPPPVDRSRPYGRRGGLRPPLALHQTDLERRMPRNPDGTVARTADPRRGGWFRLANDGGPAADATRGINCLDCTLSLFETWMHGRPRVAAPRTFDGYLAGDVHRPVGGEVDGPLRVEETTGGRFQDLCGPDRSGATGADRRRVVERGYRDLHAQLASGGHGSYAFLITSFEGGGSHAWVALNQNGTVLYLDPQSGTVADQPLYRHSGAPFVGNVVDVDALVLGPDGRPMPLSGRPPGNFTVLPEPRPRPVPRLPDPPLDGGAAPDFNRVHLLGESTTFQRPPGASPPGSAPPAEPKPDQVRGAHREAHAARIAAGLYVRDALAASGSLDAAFAAGVTPVELAQHADGPTLRRLVPGLDETAAGDLTRLFTEPRVQRMLDQSWEAPPRREELLAETLVRQLAERPDLVRMMLATPELANSLTARPVTLHHLASHQQAIDVLQDVLADIQMDGPDELVIEGERIPLPTPLTAEQSGVTRKVASRRQLAQQAGFEQSRKDDSAYVSEYLDRLYDDAAIAQVELNQIARGVAGENGRPDWRTEPKGRERVLDKLVEYGNNAARLKDLAGAKVEFERLDDLYLALGSLADDPNVLILDIKDRFASPQGSGYRDILLNVALSNGHVGELRLHLAVLEDVAKWEHALYEIRRDLDALAELGDRPLTRFETAVRDGLLRRAQSIYWSVLQDALGGV